MTRLMSSSDRREVEALKNRLFRAGIRSEICSNPIADALGITRLEVNIYESDLMEASKIRQEFLEARNSDCAPTGTKKCNGNGEADREDMELAVALWSPPSARTQPEGRMATEQSRAALQGNPGGDLAKAAVLLEKEVEEVLTRDQQLEQQCAALQDHVKALEESLAQVQTELARESSNRLAAEQRLAEASTARASSERELENMNLRLKSAEQSLATVNEQMESQSRQLKLQQARLGDLRKEISSRDSQLGALVESLAQTRAACESEKGLRQAAEQHASEQAAARKSLEQRAAHFAELEAQLRDQHHQEQEQIQACLDTVSRLCRRLSQQRIPSERA